MEKAAKTFTLTIKDSDSVLSCSSASTIMRTLLDGGLFIEANCNGRGSCGRCLVQVLEGRVADRDGNAVPPGKNNMYLACQIYPQADVTICLPRLEVSQKAQAAPIPVEVTKALLKKIVLAPAYPTLSKHYSFQAMLRQALATAGAAAGGYDNITVLRSLQEAVAAKPELITLTLLQEEVIAVEAGDTSPALFGVAFDIGTTTVVGLLVDLNTYKVVAVCSKNNPQASRGADVITRIQAACESAEGLAGLSKLIRSCMNAIIHELCSQAGIETSHIYAVTIAGNTTMSQLVLGISPSTLVKQPYAALFNHLAPLCPNDIDIGINAWGKVLILPNVASFIGSDTTAAVLAAGQDLDAAPTLLVDLGTNGEMVLHDGQAMYACSTAAGPAFEGAHIRDGMRAAPGAVSDVKITKDQVISTVIGEGKPAGICGSGMVKAIAEFIKTGILHTSGRFNQAAIAALHPGLQRRFRQSNNEWEFVLVAGAETMNGKDIAVTQSDIRQIQLVKSSLCTGIEFLLTKLNNKAETEYRIYLAGAFGNYIDIDSALLIGMLPAIKKASILSVGNAAGTGAVMALLSADNLKRCTAIADRIEYLELASQPGFQNRFLQNLAFPKN